MIPGLAGGPPFPGEAKQHSIVAIASVEKPSVPMVVGVCEIDVSGLQKVQGEKGRAVRGVHWEGDELWAWNTGDTSGGSAPERIVGWEERSQPEVRVDKTDPGEATEGSQDEGGVPLDIVHNADRGISKNEAETQLDEANADEDKPLSTKGKFIFESAGRVYQHYTISEPALIDIRN